MNVNTQREQSAQNRALGNPSIYRSLGKEKVERKDQREMRKSEDAKKAVLRGAQGA